MKNKLVGLIMVLLVWSCIVPIGSGASALSGMGDSDTKETVVQATYGTDEGSFESPQADNTVTNLTYGNIGGKDARSGYLVKFKANTMGRKFHFGSGSQMIITKTFKNLPLTSLRLTPQEKKDLEESQLLDYIEPDVKVQLTEIPPAIPSDDRLTWGNDILQSAFLHQQGYQGAGIKVALVDTGVDVEHEDLKVAGGISLLGGSFDDDQGHGTKMAGIIAAQNNSTGTVGIAPASQLYAVKAFDRMGESTASRIIEAMDWAIEQRMNIVNMSFSTFSHSMALKEAMDRASAQGLLLVGAAGNEGSASVSFPAAYKPVIAVGSVDSSMKASVFSNYGNRLELTAPGENIYTTMLDNSYAPTSGTSAAAAYVSGVAAQVWSAHPEWTAEKLRTAMLESAHGLGEKEHYGYGVVNPKDAIEGNRFREVFWDDTEENWGSESEESLIHVSAFNKTPQEHVSIHQGEAITTSIQIEDNILDMYIGVFKPNGIKMEGLSEHRIHGVNGVDLSAGAAIAYTWDTQDNLEPGTYTIKYAFCYDISSTEVGCPESDFQFWYVNVIEAGVQIPDTIPPFIQVSTGATAFYPNVPVNMSYTTNETLVHVKMRVQRLVDNNWVNVSEQDSVSNPFIWVPEWVGYNRIAVEGTDAAGNTGTGYSPSYYVSQMKLSAPTDLQADVKTEHVTVRWDPVGHANQYKLTLLDEFGAWNQFETTDPEYTFTNLKPNTSYIVSVAAADRYNQYQASDFISRNYKTKKNLVILIPGMAASELKYTYDNSTVWIPCESFYMGCIGDAFGPLELDDFGLPVHYAEGDQIDAVRPLTDYYWDLYQYIVNNGYDVVYWGYDFRADNEKTADKLNALIRAKLSEYGVDQVSIVAHSMGGLVATRYVAKYGDQNLEKLITLGTPYLGAPKSLFTLFSGNFITNGIDLQYDFSAWDHVQNTVLKSSIKTLAYNMISNYELLPDSNYFTINSQNGTSYYVEYRYRDGQWLHTPRTKKLSTYNETYNFLTEQQFNPNQANVNNRLLDYAVQFQNKTNVPQTLQSIRNKLYLIIGDDVPTVGKVQPYMQKINGSYSIDNIDSSPVNGDGTVPLRSSTVGGMFPDRTYFLTEEHTKLPLNDRVKGQVLNLLNRDPSDDNKYIQRRTADNTKNLKIRLECPVDLHVYDNAGNHVGLAVNGAVEQNIPRSSYYESGDMKVAFLKDGDYQLLLNGNGTGEMTLTLQRFGLDQAEEKTVRFDHVPVTPATVMKTTTNLDQTVVLQVDTNGDGQTDQTIQPTVILNAAGSQDVTSPTVSYTIQGTAGVDGWYTSDVSLTIQGQDSESGIHQIQYAMNGSGWNPYSTPVVLNQNGEYELQAVAVDKNRNASELQSTRIKIDKVNPTTPNILTSNAAWTNQDVQITVQPGTDAQSGVLKTEYKIGVDGQWITYAAPFSFNMEGQTKIYARTTDRAGNKSLEFTATVKMDKTPPVKPTLSLSAGDWTNGKSVVTLTGGQDALSGVKSIQYKLGANGSWTDYTLPVPVQAEGVTPVYARTLDFAGNISDINEASVKIDLTAPTAPTALQAVSKTTTSINLAWNNSTDTPSYVKGYEIYCNSAYVGYTAANTFAVTGLKSKINYSIVVKARDAAGNLSIESKIMVITN